MFERVLRARVTAALALRIVSTLGFLAVAIAGATSPAAAAPPAQYYVAMGDSLGAGIGSTSTADRYVNLIWQHELARYPALELDNLSCSGADTTSVIHGGGCTFNTGSQLGDAEAFLRAHPGQVALVTIDIGSNDVIGCFQASGISEPCLHTGLNNVATNLPQILSGLRAADPGVAIYGMDYYDPFLADWLTGAAGQSLADQSELDTVSLNTLLGKTYLAAGASMADPASRFETGDFALTGTFQGSVVPQNVARICEWTLMCPAGNIHANDSGHAELAAAFEQVIDGMTITTTALPVGTVKVRYSTQMTATGGQLPYRWSLVSGSGSLPPGLRLKRNGDLVGKPSTAGVFTFTVQALDRARKGKPPTQDRATATESITVN